MPFVEARDDSVRYRLLEPVRQYAAERLNGLGKRDEVRQRHLEYYLRFGEQREQDTNVGGAGRLAATEELIREYPGVDPRDLRESDVQDLAVRRHHVVAEEILLDAVPADHQIGARRCRHHRNLQVRHGRVVVRVGKNDVALRPFGLARRPPARDRQRREDGERNDPGSSAHAAD